VNLSTRSLIAGANMEQRPFEDKKLAKSSNQLELHKRRMLKFGKMFDCNVVVPRFIRYVPFLSHLTRMHLDAVEYPNLAYGTYAAALQAKGLGLPAVSVIEFGVASGNGLRALERHAAALEEEMGIRIEVYGFDRAHGLAKTGDPRDLPFWFSPGTFRVDRDVVQRSLKRAHYIVGDIADTLPEFRARKAAPVGFISIDVDYYTSTKDCLELFLTPQETRLPRVLCYLDDIFGISDLTIISECIGEISAINEWNIEHPSAPIQKVLGLNSKRAFPRSWNDQIYCLHDLTHPQYNTCIFNL
jgi:hypothetical protein